MKKQNKSEFGKGLVVCLAKFMEHFSNNLIRQIYHRAFLLKKSQEDQQKILSGNPPDNLNYGKDLTEDFIFFMNKTVKIFKTPEHAISFDITLWANGASDHLYDIEVPKKKGWEEIKKIINKLQDKGLDMGHGAGLMGRKEYTIKDLEELNNLTKKALILIDKKIGLKPEWGKF